MLRRYLIVSCLRLLVSTSVVASTACAFAGIWIGWVSPALLPQTSPVAILVWFAAWPLFAIALAICLIRPIPSLGTITTFAIAHASGTALGVFVASLFDWRDGHTLLHIATYTSLMSFVFALVFGFVAAGLVMTPGTIRRQRRRSIGACPDCGLMPPSCMFDCRRPGTASKEVGIRFNWLLVPLPILVMIACIIFASQGLLKWQSWMLEAERFERLGAVTTLGLAFGAESREVKADPLTPFFAFQGSATRGCFLIRFDGTTSPDFAGAIVASFISMDQAAYPLDPSLVVILSQQQLDELWSNGIPSQLLDEIDRASYDSDIALVWLAESDVLAPPQDAIVMRFLHRDGRTELFPNE